MGVWGKKVWLKMFLDDVRPILFSEVKNPPITDPLPLCMKALVALSPVPRRSLRSPGREKEGGGAASAAASTAASTQSATGGCSRS